MACGNLRQGRVDNRLLSRYTALYEPFFRCFLRFRREWTDLVTWFQRVSAPEKDQSILLEITGARTVKGEHGSRITVNPEALLALQDAGLLQALSLDAEDSVSFRFPDAQIRTWLRDAGSVLELYAWQACRETGIFQDIISSAVVDWNGLKGHENVCNEIDVMAVRGITPFFLSCKICDVRTEALNELSVLRDRFGGKGAKAAILTAEPCGAAARHRAAQLGIAVIDLEELEKNQLLARIRTIMKA